MNNEIKAYRVTSIWGGKDHYFTKMAKMCRIMNWEVQQFRNHKSRQEDKTKFTYKEYKIESILIE